MQRLPYEAKVPIWKKAGYTPHPGQIAIHKDTFDLELVSGGWRAGKSVVAAAEAFPHCLVPSPHAYLVALIGPTYKEPREEFNYIVDMLVAALPRSQFDPDRHVSRPKEGPCELTIPPQKVRNPDGTEQIIHFATVRTYTAAEAESIRGFNAECVIMCEAGGISEDSFNSIIGRVLSTGGFIFGSGTLEASQKWYHNKIKEGLTPTEDAIVHAYRLPSWSNLTAFPLGRQDPKILRAERILDEEHFRVRIGAEPIRLTGLAVKHMKAEHIRDVDFDPALPVELAIDPGYTGAYSVLAIQRYDNQIRIIDEVYERFHGTPEVIAECKRRPWWGNIDPDNPGVIDRAANQKQAVTGQSVLDLWFQETEMWFDHSIEVVPVEDGLDQLRTHLALDGHVVISPRARGLLAECDLAEFPAGFENEEPWHYKQNKDGHFMGDKALTGADHSCTAIIYWLVNRYGFITIDDITRMEFRPTRILPRLGTKELEGDEYGPVQNAMLRSVGA